MSLAGRHLYLIGFMGSGKSAMGRRLAPHLGRPFVDLDQTIERRHNATISEIFARSGEAHFRRLESALLQEVAAGDPKVVATGGGTYQSEANRTLMHESGLVLWLDVPLELALERSLRDPDRPLAADQKKFEMLYRRRRELYARADLIVPVGRDPREFTCLRILDALADATAPATGDD